MFNPALIIIYSAALFSLLHIVMPLTFVLQEHFVEILFRQLESFENQESNLSNFNFAKLPHVLASFACLF